jgi:hypothetical protein
MVRALAKLFPFEVNVLVPEVFAKVIAPVYDLVKPVEITTFPTVFKAPEPDQVPANPVKLSPEQVRLVKETVSVPADIVTFPTLAVVAVLVMIVLVPVAPE